MQERFRMFCRAGGNFYARDRITGRSESLGTADRTTARQLLAARNQAVSQPQLNRTMAKAYLSAKSPDLLTRTWADVMEHYSASGVESTRKRKAVAFRMPEREAMNHLGHKSKAIHAAYGRRASVTTLPLEYYEAQKAKKIVLFTEAQRSLEAEKTGEASSPAKWSQSMPCAALSL